MFRRLAFAVVFFFALCSSLLAWSGPGHMITAAIAYRQLSDSDKALVDALLAQHPDAGLWAAAFPNNVPGLTRGLHAIMFASNWPDKIRNHNDPSTFPNWHFVNYPLRPPNFPSPGTRPFPQDDVLFGIRESERVLANQNAGGRLRAERLSWLVHLVGDAHQPLHCAALIIPGKFNPPKGDEGGNKIFVKVTANNAARKLHGLWDGQFGTGTPTPAKIRTALNDAIQLEQQFPRNQLPEIDDHRKPASWSIESRDLAREHAYLNGTVSSNSSEPAVVLPAGYTGKAKSISARRIALAGHRLTDEIRRHIR